MCLRTKGPRPPRRSPPRGLLRPRPRTCGASRRLVHDRSRLRAEPDRPIAPDDEKCEWCSTGIHPPPAHERTGHISNRAHFRAIAIEDVQLCLTRSTRDELAVVIDGHRGDIDRLAWQRPRSDGLATLAIQFTPELTKSMKTAACNSETFRGRRDEGHGSRLVDPADDRPEPLIRSEVGPEPNLAVDGGQLGHVYVGGQRYALRGKKGVDEDQLGRGIAGDPDACFAARGSGGLAES